MSTSARRLSATVVTNRFAWQGGDRPAPPAVVSGLRGPGAPAEVSAATQVLIDLPPAPPPAERLEVIEREAYQRGRADGECAAEAAAAAAIEETAARVTAAVAELTSLRTDLMRQAERDLVRLAVAMAERVLRREVDVDRELLLVMARVAIDRLGEGASATVHLNPIDHDVVCSRHPQTGGRSIELVSDPAVPRGGCVVRSPFGTIDVGIDSQVRELSRALLGQDLGQDVEGADGAVAAG